MPISFLKSSCRNRHKHCLSAGERVNDLDAGLAEIARISSDEDQAVEQRRRSNQTVLDGHGLARAPKVSEKFGPAQSCGGLPWHTKNFRDAFPEPALQALTAFAGGKKKNAKSDFAKDERATPISRSFCFSHCSTAGFGDGLVASLSTLASIR
jgi:hypothetical protein